MYVEILNHSSGVDPVLKVGGRATNLYGEIVYGESMVKCSTLWFTIAYYGFTIVHYSLLHLHVDLLL